MAGQKIGGPREVPFIGSIGRFAQDAPGFFLALAQEYGDAARFSFFGRSFVLLSSPDLVRELLVEKADTFPKAQRTMDVMGKFLGHGLLTIEGPQHRGRRKLMQPVFHGKRIQGYAGVMVGYASAAIDGWQDGEVREMSGEMMQLTMYIVAKTLFDADRTGLAGLAGGVGQAVGTLQEIINHDLQSLWVPPVWAPTPRNQQRREVNRSLDAAIDQIVTLRRSQADAGASGGMADRGDLLSMLLQARDETGAGLSDRDLRDELVTIFLAGHETTSNALAWTWYALSRNPDVEEALHAELDRVLCGRIPTLQDLPNLPYTAQVFKETLRLYPPAWALAARMASADTTLGPYAVAKNTLVFASPYAMHRLAQYFPEPERYDPQRFTPECEAALPRYAYIPFGGGPHICIGNQFAVLEGQLLLATIAQRYRFELLPDPPVVPIPQITLGMKHGMRMRLVARRPAQTGQAPAAAVQDLAVSSR